MAPGIIPLLLVMIPAVLAALAVVRAKELGSIVNFYVTATTGLGLVISAFMNSQIAALFGTVLITLIPAIQYSGLIDPVSSLQGLGAAIGRLYPTTYFVTISRGTFSKGLGFDTLHNDLLALAIMVPVLMAAGAMLLKKQAR